VSRRGVVTMDTIDMKSNFYNKLHKNFKNMAISFLSVEQYNELIKFQPTGTGQGFLKCVSPSVKIKNAFTLKITFYQSKCLFSVTCCNM
jgi:hypothetical protein